MSNPYAEVKLPSDDAPMLNEAITRIFSHLDHRMDMLRRADNLEALCHQLHHLAAAVDRHREVMRGLNGLRRDTMNYKEVQ